MAVKEGSLTSILGFFKFNIYSSDVEVLGERVSRFGRSPPTFLFSVNVRIILIRIAVL